MLFKCQNRLFSEFDYYVRCNCVRSVIEQNIRRSLQYTAVYFNLVKTPQSEIYLFRFTLTVDNTVEMQQAN